MSDKPYIYSFGMTDPGLKRASNEDAYLIEKDSNCFVVSDGVGGAAAGEVASNLFTKTARECVEDLDSEDCDRIVTAVKQAFLLANTRIKEYGAKHRDHEGMACTAEMLVIAGDEFILGHVGDSRSYRFRDNRLVQLTKDHSFIQQQIDLGQITAEEARQHRYRNVILRALGTEDSIDVDIIRGRVKPHDRFLLCSDGLTDMVPDAFIADCLSRTADLKEVGTALVSEANKAGGKDNITAVLVSIL